jgi:hypothetical protein
MFVPVVLADESQPQSSDESPAPLSVAPLDVIDYPESRPSWVSQPLEINKDSLSIVVVSGPCETREESIEELRLMRRAAISTYVSQVSESDGQHDFYAISDEEIDTELVKRSYSGTLTQGDMTMYEDAVELRFADAQRQEIQAAWKNVEVRDRLGSVGLFVFSGLMMLICGSALTGTASRRVERREKKEATL